MNNNAWVGWAAGVYEGEGSLSVHKHGLQLGVSSTDRDVLDQFQVVVGVGRVYGPYTRKTDKPHWKPHYFYRCYVLEDIRKTLCLFEPYLCARRRARATELGGIS